MFILQSDKFLCVYRFSIFVFTVVIKKLEEGIRGSVWPKNQLDAKKRHNLCTHQAEAVSDWLNPLSLGTMSASSYIDNLA